MPAIKGVVYPFDHAKTITLNGVEGHSFVEAKGHLGVLEHKQMMDSSALFKDAKRSLAFSILIIWRHYYDVKDMFRSFQKNDCALCSHGLSCSISQ